MDEISQHIVKGNIDEAQRLINAEEYARGPAIRRIPLHPVMAYWRSRGYEVVCYGWDGPRTAERWYMVVISGPGVDVRVIAQGRDEAYLQANALAIIQEDEYAKGRSKGQR